MTLYEALQIVKFIDIWTILSIQYREGEIDIFSLKDLYDEIKTRSVLTSNYILLEEEFYDDQKVCEYSANSKIIRLMAYHLNRRVLIDAKDLEEQILIFSRIYDRTLKDFGLIDFCGRMLVHLLRRKQGDLEMEQELSEEEDSCELRHFCIHKNERIRSLLTRRLDRDFPLL